MRLPILTDTDLGSDPDDELALVLLWGSPEVEVVGVCTTDGDAALRAAIVQRMADLVGRDVDVAAGETTPLSGEARGELGRIVAREMRAWTARWDEDFVPTGTAATSLRGASEPASVGPVPHDPLAALALLDPELFTFTPPVAVEVSEDGAVRIVDGPGTVRIATGVDVEAVRSSTADRIAAGLGEQDTNDAR